MSPASSTPGSVAYFSSLVALLLAGSALITAVDAGDAKGRPASKLTLRKPDDQPVPATAHILLNTPQPPETLPVGGGKPVAAPGSSVQRISAPLSEDLPQPPDGPNGIPPQEPYSAKAPQLPMQPIQSVDLNIRATAGLEPRDYAAERYSGSIAPLMTGQNWLETTEFSYTTRPLPPTLPAYLVRKLWPGFRSKPRFWR